MHSFFPLHIFIDIAINVLNQFASLSIMYTMFSSLLLCVFYVNLCECELFFSLHFLDVLYMVYKLVLCFVCMSMIACPAFCVIC